MMKIVSAAAMLAVSASMLGTSTYAWFSMNTQVNVTGLQVTAKSNASYLLVQDSDNASTKTNKTGTAVANFVTGGTNAADSPSAGTAANSNKVVYPTYYAATNGTMPGTLASGSSSNLSVTAGHWYTANNANSNNANDATKNVQDLGTTVNANYVCTYNAWLSLTEDSETYTGKLKLTSSVASGDAGTSVVVVLDDGTTTETLKLTNATQATTTKNFTIANNTSVEVTFYVYIDGTTTNVYSDYIAGGTALTGNLSTQFDLDTTGATI